MHAAPAVGVRCAGGAAWRLFQAAMPGLAAAVAAGWAVLTLDAHAAAIAAVVAAAAGTLTVTLAWWRRAPVVVQLRWDGACWTVDDTVGALDVMIDLGAWMLLRLRPAGPGRPRWVAVAAAEAGPQWPALRAAAYAGDAAPTPTTGSPAAR